MTAAEYGPAPAPTVVFLHDSGLAGWMWRKPVEALQASYHCLVPDLPEHGQGPGDGRFSIFDAARRVAELVHARAHGDCAHLVGLGVGGQVGLALLGLAPQLVDHAVLSGVRLQPHAYAALWALAIRAAGPLKNANFILGAAMRTRQVPEAYFDEFAAERRRASPDSLARVAAESLAYTLPPGLTRLRNPTLALAGEKEPHVFKRSARLLSGSLLGGTAAMIRNVGHNWPMAAPDLFVRVARAWFGDAPLPAEAVPVPRR